MTSTPTHPGPSEPLDPQDVAVQTHGSGWRGVSGDSTLDQSDEEAGLRLRDRSRDLLRDLLRPHRSWLWIAIGIVVIENAARLSIPFLVKEGIDRGIPPIRETGSTTTLYVIVGFVRPCARSSRRSRDRSSSSSPAGSARTCSSRSDDGCSATSRSSALPSTTTTPPAG